MQPGPYSFTIRQGETWQEVWTRAGVTSAVGWSCQIDFRTHSNVRVLRLTSGGGGIALTSDDTNLIATITITEPQTTALPVDVYTYDWRLVRPDGSVEYLLAGTARVVDSITEAV